MKWNVQARCGTAALLVAVTALCSCEDKSGGDQAPISALPLGDKKLTVVAVVIDSLMPAEINTTLTNIDGLRASGTAYPESRAVFSAETLPNHVAMMTGVYPARNGIANNSFIDFGAGGSPTTRDLSVPEKLTSNTLFTWIKQRCRDTSVNPQIRDGATLSKKYLFEIFQGDANDAQRQNDNPGVFNEPPDSSWNPQTSPLYLSAGGANFTPDIPTMQQALSQLPSADFLFINLGDTDRGAHVFGQAERSVSLLDTDAQVGRLVQALKDAGRWNNTVLFLLSDHGMDFSTPGPGSTITVQPALDKLGACFAPMQAVQNGGVDSIYVTDRNLSLSQQQQALRAARGCLTGATPCDQLCAGTTLPANSSGIDSAWYTTEDPADPAGTLPANLVSGNANFGGLVLNAKRGFKFSDPSATSNPLPGNHGHVTTLRSTMIVSGGSPWVKKAQVVTPSIASSTDLDRLPEQAETVDLAPTIAWLLGLEITPAQFPDFATAGRGFDGRVLKEAFTQFDGNADAPSPTVCGRYN